MRASDLPLMIFAAGLGTRMGDLTATRPKPMVEVAGMPLIDHAIALARAAGVTRVVANTHYRPDSIEPHLAQKGVEAVRETPRILDTGGGLKHALPRLGDARPVFTLNSDNVWAGPDPLGALAAAWREGMSALLLTVPLGRAHGRKGGGDFALRDGQLTRGGDQVYTGLQLIDPDLVRSVPDPAFSLSRIWSDLAAEGRLAGVEWSGHWADVGHPEGIGIAEALLARA